jgi:hypothetical protein
MLISSLYAASVHQDLLNTDSKTSKNNTTSDVNKEKKYRVKDDRWYCNHCDIFCNSDSQYQVHLMSSKHKTAKSASEDGNNVKITYTSKFRTDVCRHKHQTKIIWSMLINFCLFSLKSISKRTR